MRSLPPRRPLVPRVARWKVVRLLKMALCALLVFGLSPGRDEIVETVAHLLHDGHLPHSEAHDPAAATEDCGGSDEHDCTPLAHRCHYCASVAAVPPAVPDIEVDGFRPVREKFRSLHERGPPNTGVKPLLNPPIA